MQLCSRTELWKHSFRWGIPLAAELQHLRSAREEHETRRQFLRDKIEGIENDIATVNGELEGLMQQGVVPTAEHLAEQRGLRESLWQKIHSKVYPAQNERRVEEALPTAAEYEFAVQAADVTADSRFADAARVSQHSELLKRQAQMRNVIELERTRLETVDKGANELKLQWQALIDKYGLPSLGVAEMTDWLNKRELFLQRYEAYVDVKHQASMADERAVMMRTSLSFAFSEARLPACGENETIAQAVGRARAFVDHANKAAASQKVLSKRGRVPRKSSPMLMGRPMNPRGYWKNGELVGVNPCRQFGSPRTPAERRLTQGLGSSKTSRMLLICGMRLALNSLRHKQQWYELREKLHVFVRRYSTTARIGQVMPWLKHFMSG
ncbi:MAG: hypothetical protein IPN81_10995 [Nitrosomonadales bacterium]|nr:hypothetical protein [Nitrosomonadales bacterium]